MNDQRLMQLVDARDFRELFIEELGWENPDQAPLRCKVDNHEYFLTQVAGFKGLRIWYCPDLPGKKIQRQIDELVGQNSLERLVIFANLERQEWRWPRRAQLGGANAKLLVHQHVVGEVDTHMENQLASIAIDFDENLSLVELLTKMRVAFDAEAEMASVQAARLMGTLYSELASAGATERDATLLLARLLFLLFGDDSGMWGEGKFRRFLTDQTDADGLHGQLHDLFDVLNADEGDRTLSPDSPLADFRYVNGGLFSADLTIVPLTSGFRGALIDACEFDWAVISPAIFGSMFQTVKNREARRHGGEHYTAEADIIKTIGPLFLDEFTARLEASWDDQAQMTKLHNDLGKLRFLDPACGCGNFLIVAYRELRALELQLLTRRRDLDIQKGLFTIASRGQLSFDVTGDIKVTLDHFFGIEIEEWPARIAETAMLLVDHLANQRMEQDFGDVPDRLPIKIAPTILHGNALEVDWASLVQSGDNVIIFGNPPFVGQYTKTAAQTADTKRIWGSRYNGYLDYVSCWYAKVIDYYGSARGRWAFVSTNSICQGEPVEFLWRPILAAGWRCRFAHRSFQWVTEAPGGAAVHVSIVGFDKATTPKPVLWVYPEGGKGDGTATKATRINPYLIDAPNVLVANRAKPLSPVLPVITYGSKPTDGGKLLVSGAEVETIRADPIAAKYLREFIGARELLHGSPRWCLWLVNVSEDEVEKSAFLSARIAAVKQLRAGSSDAATNRAAAWPHKFQYVRQLQGSYLAIPAHVGEHRRYFTTARCDPDVVCGNANFMVEDPEGFALGILSSSMFIAWMRAIGGRLKSDLRFSNTFTYNTFPLPMLNTRQKKQVVEAASRIIKAREAHPGLSLADLYDPQRMPTNVVDAHDELDQVVDRMFGVLSVGGLEARQRALFRYYAKLTGQETLFDI